MLVFCLDKSNLDTHTKIKEIFDIMNVTTRDYANLYCVVKKIYDVIVSRSYQERLAVCIYINLYETFQKCDNINFKLETSI